MKNIATDKFFLEDIFITGWAALKSIFKKSIPIVILIGFPANLLYEFTISKIPFDTLVESGKITNAQSIKIMNGIQNAVMFLIFSIASIAIIKCAEKAITQREITWQEALSHGFRRWPSYLETGILGGLIVFGLLFLLIVPGIIWSVYYIFAMYVVTITSLNGKKALNYSKSLVKGQWFRTIGYCFTIGFAAMIPTMILSLLVGVISKVIGNVFTSNVIIKVIIDAGLDTVISLVTPLQLTLCTVFFLNTAYLKRAESATE